MTIDEAIKILETEAHLAKRQPETGVYEATKLGGEALKRVREERTGYESYAPDLLLGETT